MYTLERVEKMSPAELFAGDKINEIIESIKKEALSFVNVDITTAKGRKEIASHAHAVAKSKTFLDKAGKILADEYNAKLKPINGQRKLLRDELDLLKESIRKPLTDWEDAQKERQEKFESILELMRIEQDFLTYQAPEIVAQRLSQVKEILIDESFAEYKEKAEELKPAAIKALEQRLKELKDLEQKRLEEEQKQKELEEKQRIEREKLIAENARKEAIEAERKRAEEEKARLIAEQEAKAEAERKRAEDVKHRSIINNSILDYMKRKGCPEDAAKEIIKGIVKKETQNIYIKY